MALPCTSPLESHTVVWVGACADDDASPWECVPTWAEAGWDWEGGGGGGGETCMGRNGQALQRPMEETLHEKTIKEKCRDEKHPYNNGSPAKGPLWNQCHS